TQGAVLPPPGRPAHVAVARAGGKRAHCRGVVGGLPAPRGRGKKLATADGDRPGTGCEGAAAGRVAGLPRGRRGPLVSAGEKPPEGQAPGACVDGAAKLALTVQISQTLSGLPACC